MTEIKVNRKRILKNTVMLYARLLFSMLISLYTSRIVLNQLGVSDYGIYGLVGGIVAMFGFLNSSMSGATSRFLTVSLAKGDKDEINRTFCAALIVHIIIAIIVLFLAETVGLWFVNTKLNIDPTRIHAAQYVYQFSIISAIISITQVPYNASLIAHERMDLYAWVDILAATLKLGIAFLLLINWFDSLIMYAIMVLLVTITIAMIYRVICIKKYSETRFKWIWTADIGKNLLSFSGWNLYSQFCFVGRQQGTNILLNIFGSTAVNAAAGLATTVQNIIEQGATNLVMASRPQIISQHAVKHYKEMISLMNQTSILANVLYCIVAVPFILEIEYVLSLWLKIVPDYTIPFCMCIIAMNFITINSNIIYIGIQAEGKMKTYSFAAGTCSLLIIPIVWLMFKMGYSLVWAFAIPILSNMLIYWICSYIFRSYVLGFSPISYFLKTMGKTILVVIPCILVSFLIKQSLSPSFLRVVLTTATCLSIIIVLSYYVMLDNNTRKKVISIVKSKLKIS